MLTIRDAVSKGEFIVTAELAPVKGTNLDVVLNEALKIKDKVHGVNVTDNQRSIMRSAPIALSRLLVERGVNPVCQITCRDRNRIALQSDLLAMSILGIKEVLLLTGDAISAGDHPDAKPVFDLDSISLIKTAKILAQGKDLAGKELNGKPDFFIGAAVNPGVEPAELQAMQTARKIEAGADFFQTQLIFDTAVVEKFIEALAQEGIGKKDFNVIAGIFPLKSLKQALFFNSKIPGIKIPEIILKKLENAADQEAEGLDIAWQTIKALQGIVNGVHLMAMGNNKALEFLLENIKRENF